MTRTAFSFCFSSHVPLEEILLTLDVACLAAEALYGAARVRLEATHIVDHANRNVLIDEHSEAGRALARIFAGLLQEEFGEDAFTSERRCVN